MPSQGSKRSSCYTHGKVYKLSVIKGESERIFLDDVRASFWTTPLSGGRLLSLLIEVLLQSSFPSNSAFFVTRQRGEAERPEAGSASEVLAELTAEG